MRLLLPLSAPPRLVQLGCNVHGRLPHEHFRLPGLWGVHLYHYAGSVSIAGRRVAFAPGDLTLTPPDTDLEWAFPATATHHYALFSVAGGGAIEVPALTSFGTAAAFHREVAAWAAAVAAQARQPQRSAAWLWDLLWRLAPARHPPAQAAGVPELGAAERVPPPLQTALRLIDAGLGGTLTLTGLARRAGISPNHLNRLMRVHAGRTVMAMVRRRRAERARDLLRDTAMPAATVAVNVGLRDHRQLNKLVWRELGASPRRLRFGG